MTEPGRARSAATKRALGAIALSGVAAAAGFWAGRIVFLPPSDPLDDTPEPITYTVAQGELERSLRFTAVAEWRLIPTARNAKQGVVTTVEFHSGGVATPGQIICTVDLRPIVVAEGKVPAFRSMSLNARGADVAQLQTFLADLGLFTQESDGVFGTSTRAAVMEWQRMLGVRADGIVGLGDVVFVPTLPAHLTLDPNFVPGTPLAGGEPFLSLVPDAPEFRVPLAQEQLRLVPLTAQVRVSYADGEWSGRIEQAVEDSGTNLVNLLLTAEDGGPVCGGNCTRWVDLGAPTDFDVEIVVIPHTVGPAVPVAAIHSDAGNQTYVITSDGTRIDITVVVAAKGIAIVEGLDQGTVIALPIVPVGG